MADRPLIVLTTDFSDQAVRAYAPTVDVAKRMGAGILLLHVVEVAAVLPHGAPLAPAQFPPDTAAEVDAARGRIAQEAARLGSEVPVDTLVEASHDVVEKITSIASERGATMIAISTHGRRGLQRLVLGSIAESVVRHATVPVLAFPGGAD